VPTTLTGLLPLASSCGRSIEPPRHRLTRNYLEALLAQRGVAADDR